MDIVLVDKYNPSELAINLQKYICIDHREGITTVLDNILSGITFTLVKTKGTHFSIQNYVTTEDGKDHSITKVIFEDKNTYLLFENLLLGFWNNFDVVRKGHTVHEYSLTKSSFANLIVLEIQLNKEEYRHSYAFIIHPEFIKDLPMKDLVVV